MPPDTGSPFPFSRKAIIEADGSRWINQIHRDDIATALCLLVESSARSIFNVTDDHPLPQREIYTWLAHRFALPCPPAAQSTPTANAAGRTNASATPASAP